MRSPPTNAVAAMVDLPEKKAGIVACSGEELAEGTVTRLAALRVLERLRLVVEDPGPGVLVVADDERLTLGDQIADAQGSVRLRVGAMDHDLVDAPLPRLWAPRERRLRNPGERLPDPLGPSCVLLDECLPLAVAHRHVPSLSWFP